MGPDRLPTKDEIVRLEQKQIAEREMSKKVWKFDLNIFYFVFKAMPSRGWHCMSKQLKIFQSERTELN
jgi:hypothetical protein